MSYLSPHQAISLEVVRAVIEELALKGDDLPLQEISNIDWMWPEGDVPIAVAVVRNGQYAIEVAPDGGTSWRAENVLGGEAWASTWGSTGSFQVKDACRTTQTGTWRLKGRAVELASSP